MSTWTIILAVAVIILVLIVALKTVIDRNKNLKQMLEGYKIENQSLKSNIAYLVKHLEEMQKIKAEAENIESKIEGAKTDEEIADIVDIIISANNDRVQND